MSSEPQPATFMHLAIRQLFGFDEPARTRVMDFGCGSGGLVESLASLGYDASGCDVEPYWESDERTADSTRLGLIRRQPYSLPYDDGSLDVVVSTSVLEHAQNTEEAFREIHRVLRPGGCALHLLPAKWYLPYEPHIYVPLANAMWPHCPAWWLGLWAWLGVRNEFQTGKSWRDVRDMNQAYCRTGLNYLPTSAYDRLSTAVFGGSEWPMEFYIDHGYGRVAEICRRLPFRSLWGALSREFRIGILVQRKR